MTVLYLNDKVDGYFEGELPFFFLFFEYKKTAVLIGRHLQGTAYILHGIIY